MKFFAATELGPTRSISPEGYLICQDVTIARLGTQEYAPGELGGEIDPDSRGIITVERVEDEVFRPESIASFHGKPIIITNHEMLDPSTWRSRAVGTVLSPRRGDGDAAGFLIADMMIYEQSAIDAIQGGLREVSCGYYADYEMVSPGRGRQVNIVGNHVALVNRGRCGAVCAIGDSDMVTTTVVATGKKKVGLFSLLRKRIKAGDEAGVEEVLTEMGGEEIDPAGGTTINLILPGSEPKPEGAADEANEPTIADVMAAIAGIGERVAKLEEGDKPSAEAKVTDEVVAETDEEKAARIAKEKDDAAKATGDSAGLASEFQEAMAGAEIIAPGIKLPVFDAKAAPQTTSDTACGLRRASLKQYGGTAPGREWLAGAGATMDSIGTASCDAVKTLFGFAVREKRSAVALGIHGSVRYPDLKALEAHKPLTNSELNAAARKRHGYV